MKLFYFSLLIFVIFFESCKIDTCTDGTPSIWFDGFDSSETNVIAVKEYEPGAGWNKLKRTFYTGYSVKELSADSIPWQKLRIVSNSFYVFTILKSGKPYSLFNMEHKTHKMTRYVGSERKGCVNGFSYWINTKVYHTPFQEYLSYGTPKLASITIYKE